VNRSCSGLLVICFLMCGPARAQKEATGTTPEANVVGFELIDNYLITVRGTIGDIAGLKFVIDTGATYSVVDESIVRRLQLARSPGKIFRFDHYANVEWAVLPQLIVGPLSARNAKVVVDRLPYSTEKISAIIGLDLLSGRDKLLIDFDDSTISFGNRFERGTLRSLTAPIVVQGKTLNLVVDSGMRGYLLYGASSRHIPAHAFKVDTTKTNQGESRRAGISSGSERDDRIVTIARPSSGVPARVDGYAGLDTLKAHVIELDFENMRIRWN
jgi:predicted aspartyl protease